MVLKLKRFEAAGRREEEHEGKVKLSIMKMPIRRQVILCAK